MWRVHDIVCKCYLKVVVNESGVDPCVDEFGCWWGVWEPVVVEDADPVFVLLGFFIEGAAAGAYDSGCPVDDGVRFLREG